MICWTIVRELSSLPLTVTSKFNLVRMYSFHFFQCSFFGVLNPGSAGYHTTIYKNRTFLYHQTNILPFRRMPMPKCAIFYSEERWPRYIFIVILISLVLNYQFYVPFLVASVCMIVAFVCIHCIQALW